MSKTVLQSSSVATPRGIMSQGIGGDFGPDGVRLRSGGPRRERGVGGPR